MNTEANKSNNEHSFRGLFVKVFFGSHKSWIKNSLYLQSLKINRRTTNVPFEVYSLRLSLVLKNLELKAVVGATPQFWNICAQNDISVQHLGSGIYAFSTYPDKPETKVGEKVFGWVGSNTLYLFRHCWHLKPFIDVLYFITSYSLYTLYTRAAILVYCE